jgi:hypothetical protein
MISRDAPILPGPGSYQVAEGKDAVRSGNRGIVRATANFVSQSDRIGKPPKSLAVSGRVLFEFEFFFGSPIAHLVFKTNGCLFLHSNTTGTHVSVSRSLM